MIQAMPGKVVVKKVKEESLIKGIYMNTTNYYYEIKSVLTNEYGLQIGDKIIVRDEDIYMVINDNEEVGIIDITKVLAVIK
ncbi:MAG: hypothetical protein IJX78_01670 [Bacilli bacterium]|nr:hypothetical protein [Bacilli bacterium]